MNKFKVRVNYKVKCSASGYMYVEASDEEEAMDMAGRLESEIDNTDLDEEEIIGDIEVVDVEML